MNRRQFLKTIGYLAGALALPFNMLAKKVPLPPEVHGEFGRIDKFRFIETQDWKHAPTGILIDKRTGMHTSVRLLHLTCGKPLLSIDSFGPDKEFYLANIDKGFKRFYTKKAYVKSLRR